MSHSQPPAASALPDSRPTPGLRVLVAEDTPAHRQLLTRMLQRHGHAITLAENGQQAIELFGAGQFDVVLMDVQMPIVDGCEAATAIRRIESDGRTHTPIMGLTAQATPEIVARCRAAGMDDCIAKPIDTAILMQLLRTDIPPVKRMDGSLRPLQRPAHRAVIDLDATLRRLGGDRELLQDFVEIYDKDAHKLLATLRSAIANNDLRVAELAAHSLRGLAANFGAQATMDVAADLEKQAKAAKLTDAEDLLDRLDIELNRLHEALNQVRRPSESS